MTPDQIYALALVVADARLLADMRVQQNSDVQARRIAALEAKLASLEATEGDR
jgi:hypothetical protein